MALLLVLLPIVGAAVALAISSNRIRPWILPLTGLSHLIAVFYVMQLPEVEMFSQTLKLDPVGRVRVASAPRGGPRTSLRWIRYAGAS